jgi:hypothetical protein
MAETLGSLCDKFTIVKLKLYHSDDQNKLQSLQQQKQQLIDEIDDFITDAINGVIPTSKLTFHSNKVYKGKLNEIQETKSTIGCFFSKLAEINCLLWHEQEKVYEFEKIAINEKDKVINQLAILNLKRTKCIDDIDDFFVKLIEIKESDNG